jgi:biopolymer transport protein ExbD
MGLSVGGTGARVRPALNVTPLVDVVLVLLIVFMVVTPMLVRQMRVHVPQKEDATAAPRDPGKPPAVLRLRAGGVLEMDGAVIPRGEVVARLRAAARSGPDDVVYFDADESVPYGEAVAILDLAREGGAPALAILPE